jgi:hypothetical protein
MKKKCSMSTRTVAAGGGRKADKKGKGRAKSPVVVSRKRKPVPMVVIPVKKPRLSDRRPSTSKRVSSDVAESSGGRGSPLDMLERPGFDADISDHIGFVRDQVTLLDLDISKAAEGLGGFAADVNRQHIWFVQQLNRIRHNQSHILSQLDVIATRLSGSK